MSYIVYTDALCILLCINRSPELQPMLPRGWCLPMPTTLASGGGFSNTDATRTLAATHYRLIQASKKPFEHGFMCCILLPIDTFGFYFESASSDELSGNSELRQMRCALTDLGTVFELPKY